MENNLELLFFFGFARSVKTIRDGFPHLIYVAQHRMDADLWYGRQLQDGIDHLQSLAVSVNAVKLRDLLPRSLEHALLNDYECRHTAIQLKLDKIVESRHNDFYNLS